MKTYFNAISPPVIPTPQSVVIRTNPGDDSTRKEVRFHERGPYTHRRRVDPQPEKTQLPDMSVSSIPVGITEIDYPGVNLVSFLPGQKSTVTPPITPHTLTSIGLVDFNSHLGNREIFNVDGVEYRLYYQNIDMSHDLAPDKNEIGLALKYANALSPLRTGEIILQDKELIQRIVETTFEHLGIDLNTISQVIERDDVLDRIISYYQKHSNFNTDRNNLKTLLAAYRDCDKYSTPKTGEVSQIPLAKFQLADSTVGAAGVDHIGRKKRAAHLS